MGEGVVTLVKLGPLVPIRPSGKEGMDSKVLAKDRARS